MFDFVIVCTVKLWNDVSGVLIVADNGLCLSKGKRDNTSGEIQCSFGVGEAWAKKRRKRRTRCC